MKKTLLLALILTLFRLSYAQEEIKVLWLGNSYTFFNNLPEMINELSFGTDKVVLHESITPGGCTLFQHVDSPTSLDAIRKGYWDFVVLQEQSQLPSIDYYRHNSMRPAYQALYDTIMLYNPEAKVVGYMTWGRQYGGQQCVNFGQGIYCSADFVDFNHMQDTMSVAYCENAYATDSYVAPVGDAWKESLNSHPEITLHISDQSHPTYEGSYLAACVFHAVFWKESPIGVYHNTQIDDEKAALLQEIASNVVFNNLEKWNIDIDFEDINDNIKDQNFEIISNLNEDRIFVKNTDKISATVRIISINGNVVYEQNIDGDTTINIENSKGIYIIQIIDTDNHSKFTKKIIKQ